MDYCYHKNPCNVLLCISSRGRASFNRPTRTYRQQLCEDTRCSLEYLLGAIEDMDKCSESQGKSVLVMGHDDDYVIYTRVGWKFRVWPRCYYGMWTNDINFQTESSLWSTYFFYWCPSIWIPFVEKVLNSRYYALIWYLQPINFSSHPKINRLINWFNFSVMIKM